MERTSSQAAPRKLQTLELYFRAKTDAIDEDETDASGAHQRSCSRWHSQLLEALGYNELTRFDIPVEGGDALCAGDGTSQSLQPTMACHLRDLVLSS